MRWNDLTQSSQKIGIHKAIQDFIDVIGERALNITTRTGLLGFLLALSALPISAASAVTSQTITPDSTIDQSQTVESRLTRLTEVIRQREPLLFKGTNIPVEMQIARGAWGNGGGGGFANRTGPGGFINNRGGGGFVNGGGFRNGGGFWNY